MLNPPHRRETRFLPERDGPNEDAEGSFRGAGSEGFADRADGNARPSQAKPSHGDKPRSTDQAGGGVSARARVAAKTSC